MTEPRPPAKSINEQEIARRRAALAQRAERLASGKRVLLEQWLDQGKAAALPSQTIPRRTLSGPARLSFAQERLWFLDRLDPGSVAYNLPSAVRFQGGLEVPALAAALRAIVLRHEVLRTTFQSIDDEPFQVLMEEWSLPLPQVDLGALPEGVARSEARRLATMEARAPFDLERGPLLRAGLLRLAERDYVLLVTMHHIVSDAWSMAIFSREVAALYQAFSRRWPSPLPELPIQYADFALWQRERLAGAAVETEAEYWRRRLAGSPALLDLPADRPRPPLQSFRGGRRSLALPVALAGRLEAFSRSLGATPFMSLLAAFQALLARCTGSADIPVGTPSAGRTRRETEELIGFFVNTLVIRGDLSGDPSFRDLVERVRERVIEAQNHQEIPFEKLVELLRPERSTSYSPLFQVMFDFEAASSNMGSHRASNGGQEGPGLRTIALEPGSTGMAKFDLTLVLGSEGGGLGALLEYSSDLFDSPTAVRLLHTFAVLLAGAVEDPGLPLSELPLLGEAERHQIAREWSPRSLDRTPEDCLHDLVAAQAMKTPDALAIVHAGEALTYRELERRASGLARKLQDLSVGPESRVGVFLERTPAMVVALLATLKAGGAYVPLDPAYPRERLAFLLADSGASVLLTRSDLAERLPEQRGIARVCVDEASYADDGLRFPGGATPGNLAYVIYTSGSTGRPKGVAIEHRSAAALLDWARRAYSDEEMDGVLAGTSICFDLSVFELFAPLSRGGRVVLARDALDLPALEGAGVRLVNTVPSAITELLRLDGLPASVRTVNLAGEPLRRSLAEQLHQRQGITRVLNLYGPSEDTTYSTGTEIPRGLGREPGIGWPLPGTSAHVLDAGLRPVPIGVPGELCLGGAGLARGYLGRPDLTAERFIPDPFSGQPGARLYRTGDLARRRADGELEFLGRLDHQVKVRGFRIELGEVEAALACHPGIREAVVLPQGEDADRRLVAFLVPVDGAPPSAGEMRAFLMERLPDPMLPAGFHLLQALPLTPNGKVDRAALSRGVPLGPEERSEALRGPVEEIVAAVWAEVLGVGGIGPASDFFALGGHSLLATKVVSRLRSVFAVDLPLRAVFERRTVEALAQLLETELRSGKGGPASAIGPAPRTGPLTLSFAQLRLWFLHRLAPDSPAYNLPMAVRFENGLEVAAMNAALGEMVRRHESLRTVFHTAPAGEPVQSILPAAPVRLPVIDLGALPEERRLRDASALAATEARRPFDLETGPLMRLRVLRLTALDHVLLGTLHHIVADGWSLHIFEAEVTSLYEAFREGRPSPLPEPSLQYADFAVWQRRWLEGEVLESQLAYWRRQLRDLPPPLPLPAARPRPAAPRSRGAVRRMRLSAELTAELRALARAEGCTPFIVLLAALQALLGRYTGQADFCVGTPIAGRNRVETEGVIGCFLNTLALRADLAGDPAFRDLLGRVRETSLGAYAHQDLPFERLLEDLQLERDLRGTPVFQVLFNFLNLGPQGGVSRQPRSDGAGALGTGVKLDLSVQAMERDGEIDIELQYDADLFDAAQVARMADHLREILAGAAAQPGRRISDLPLESPAVRSQQRAAAWAEPSLGERFRSVARTHARRLAVATPDHQWTYERLDRLSDRVARGLTRLSDSPRIGLLFAQGAPRIAAVLAALKAGRTYIPLDPDYPEARLAAVLGDADAGAVLTDEAHVELARRLGAAVILPIGFPEEEEEGAVPAEELPAVAPETPAYILYTSGSTGEPKGVVQSHRNVLHHIRAYSDALHIAPADRLTLLPSYAFDAAVMDIFGALLNGAALFPFDLRRNGMAPLAGWLREQRITVYHSTPSVYRRFLDELGGEVLPEIRLVVLGGEKCLRRDLERFRAHFPPESLFVNGLGPTESTLALQFFASAGGAVDRETVPVGHPVAGTEVLLRHALGEQVAIYGVGEIEIRSPFLALGYWRRPDLTATAFLEDPEGGERRVYRTGDLGRWLPDGSLEFVGRNDSQVKIRGHRVELGEVEAALNALPGVREAVVVVREDRRTGEPRLVAYLLAPEGRIAPLPLRRLLRQRLPDPMIPADFVAVEAWPLTSTGKIDRRALPDPPRASGTSEAGTAAPRTPLEELLCGIWAEVLGREEVGVDGDFFALGGHSLLATQLLSRIRQVVPVEMPLRAVFEAPTPAAAAAWLDQALLTAEAGPRPPIVPVPREEALPLSFSQQRFWFLEQLQPGSAYNLPSAVRLSGSLDVPALAGAFLEIARRHEVLRTTFKVLEGEPVQVIAAGGPVPLPVVDLSSLPSGPLSAEARGLAAEEVGRPFDLERGPLFRTGLLRLEAGEYVLMVNFHHAITDGWSQAIFWRELSALYSAFARRHPSPLRDLPLQYADFSVWQRRWLTGEVLAEQLAYWRKQLQDVPPRLDLPTDRPRPAFSSMRGATRPLDLPACLGGMVRGLGRRTGTTPFMILLTALQALLARHTGEEDLCVGTPIAGRTQVELEGLIGLFVNTLVMRGDLAGDPSFSVLLQRTREAALQAHAHQDLPFERLVEELQPERNLGLSPFFQVMLAFQNVRRDPAPDLPHLELGVFPIPTGTVKFDLSLTVSDVLGGFGGTVEYAAELFDAATIERLLGHLSALLEGAAEDPGLRLSELPLLGVAERHQLLVEWGDTAAADPRESLTLHELVLAQAERSPDAVAVIAGGQRFSYRELDVWSARIANRLAGEGVGEGAFVPVLIDGGMALVAALLGVLRTGAAFVPLDPAWPETRLTSILDEIGDPGRDVVLVDREPAVDFGPWRPLDVGGIPRGDTPSPGAVSALPEAPIYAIYTSGSTGRPKGVVVPHRGIVNRFLWMDRFFGAAAAVSVLQTTRHIYDSAVWQIFWPLTHGGASVLTDPGKSADPAYLCGLIESHGVTLTDFVPSVFNVLMQQLEEGTEGAGRLGSLRAVIVGGEEMAPAAARSFLGRFPEVKLVNLYGPTEASIGCIHHQVAAGDGSFGRVPIGRPISNVHPVVLDRWGKPAPVGVPGELCLAGRCLGMGYLREGGQTGGVFVPNPFPEILGDRLYRTGDLARRLPGGEIDFLGRIDRQVKIRGVRIELGEIEAALRRHPGVAAAVVLVWPEGADSGHRMLAAFFVAGPGGGPSGGELRETLRERLPAAMVPALLVEMEALPVTPGGKVDRKALARVAAERWRGDDERTVLGPRTPFEEILAGIWIDVLRIGRVGPDDEFFALGGHSLLATQVTSRIRQAFEIELPVRALFEAPTLAGLARRIEEAVHSGAAAAAPPVRRAPRAGALPLSFAQQRLWFLDRLTPGAPLYHLFTPFLLEGDLDHGALARSLSEVVRRHESLRTSFPSVEGEPVQDVAPALPVPLPLVDLQGLAEGDGEAEVRRWIGVEARRPFDLARGPLLRALLIRLAPDRHVVLFSVHHMVCDGWSLRLLIGELSACYSHFVHGEPPLPPEPPLQYADFAVWQRQWLQGEALELEIDYWRQQVAGAPPVLEIPADRPRPAIQSFRGGRLPVSLPSSLSSGLGLLARRERSTLFMVLLAGLDALLFRYTGQERILAGTPIANRNRAEIEGLIGNFANTLVLGASLHAGLSFREALAGVRESALGAYAHQDLPFEVLVEALSPRRDLSYNPIFQVLFGLHNLPLSTERAAGLSLRPLGTGVGVARFDLALDLNETPEGVQGSLEFATDLFDASTARRMAGHLRVLLESVLDLPDSRLDELPLLTREERQQLLVEWSGACAGLPAGGRLHELFEDWAERTPDAVALVSAGERLTYGELNRRANRLAHRLRRLGAGPEVPVGLYLERSPDLVAALLAALKAGAAYLPLDPGYPRQRIARILDTSAAPLLVTRGSLAGDLPPHSARVLDLDEDPLPGEPEHNPAAASLPGNLAYVIFTSGSTGIPKGVQVTHRSAVHLVETARPLFGLGPGDVWTVVHSFAFDFSVWEIWGALALGGRLVVVPAEVARSPRDLAELILAERVTVLGQTPSALRQLLEEGGPAAEQALRAPKLIVCGGEAFPADLAPPLLARGARVWNFYGPTESTVWAAAGPVRSVSPEAAVPLGAPLPDNQLFVLDAGARPLPVGVAGELCIAGAGLARGYFRAPDLTAEKFVPHPFAERRGERLYRTGDLVRRRAGGELEFLGRIDQQVKVRGFRIELGEIEKALAEHPGVGQAVVTAADIAPGERGLVAYLTPAGDVPAAEDLRRFVAACLPDYMVPSLFVILDSLPLTSNGKVDRRALSLLRPGEAGGSLPTGTAHVPPRDELELRLVRIWEGLLPGRRVGVTDDFFDLGGHSLLAVRLLSRIRGELGPDLPLSVFFQHSTVERLAPLLRRSVASEAARPALVEIQAGGEGRPLFLVHPAGGNVLCYLDLAQSLGPGRPVYGLQLPGADAAGGIEDLAELYLKAVRSVQPEGPYALGGWSMGGMVVFEMARRLVAAGERVEPLALIDSQAPQTGEPGADDLVSWFARELARSAGHDLVLPTAPSEDPEARLGRLYEEALAAGLLPPDLELGDVHTLFSFFRFNAEAMRRYAGGTYPGRIVLFRADAEIREGDPSLGWERFAAAVEVRDLPGDHHTILRRPAVDVLARELSFLLDPEGRMVETA